MVRSSEQNELSDSLLRRELSRRGAVVGTAKFALGGALGLTALTQFAPSAFAQATPAALDLSAYPELKITVTDTEMQLATNTVPSGYVLLTVSSKLSDPSNSGGAAVVGPPAGMSFADFMTQVQPKKPAGGTPSASSGNGGPPPIAYKATIPGGPGNIDPGQTGQAIVHIPAGQWAVGVGGNKQPFVPLTATPGASGAMAEPKAAVTITEIDFSFAGFDHVPAGPQIWKVIHKGTQPHMLILVSAPAGTTMAQVMALINAPNNATPMPGGLDPNTLKDMGGVAIQSAGTTVWPVLDLPAGRYVAICFFGDPTKGGESHAMEGMVSLFDAGM